MMKKVRFLAAMLCIPLFGGTLTYANEVCDQTFYGKLRYGNGYIFDDSFNGTKSQSYYMWNYKVNSSEQYDYNNSPDFPSFGWTQEIKDQKYEVKPGQSIKIIQAKTPYYINAVPQKRDQKNLTVKYTITYSTDEAGKNKTSHVECKYYEITWCGDGVLDEDKGEQCDPNDPNKTGWGNGGCDASCKPVNKIVVPPQCNGNYDKKTAYNANYPIPRLNSTMPLCNPGEVVTFVGPDAQGNYSWGCKNNGVTTVGGTCTAKDERCGDGKKNGPEQCDPNDPNKTGWGNGGCDVSCKPVNGIDSKFDCDQTFYGELRYGRGYIFDDTFNGTASKTYYLKDFNVDYKEQFDFNNSPGFPEFTWTREIIDQNYIVRPNQSIKAIVAKSPYYINAVPEQRSKDNLYLEYTIAYSDSSGGSWVSHKECKYYEVTWCGDGILDTKYGEQCDPKDPNKTGWGNGGCDASCKPITTVVKPECNSEYNGKKFYNKNYPTAWLNAGMNLCNPGEVISFVGPNANGIYTWGCKLGDKKTESNECQGRELWCGDGIVQSEYGEECDPNASLQSSNKICNNKCKWEDKLVYDLALTKKLATNKKKYELGDLVDFTITVYNQGNLPAKNIQVTEYIPEGLILEDAAWTKNGNKATRMITETILPGASKALSLTMRISDTFKGIKILNKAEISKDNSGDYNTTDKDSTPDQNPDNDCIVGEDNHYTDGDGKKGGDCTPATDEDDHDVVPVIVKPEDPFVPPYIEKDLIGDKEHKYKVGELVGFKMPFGNTGSKTLLNVKIRDILPLNLEYVSSEIHGVSPYTKGLTTSGGVQIFEYSGFNLAPGQKGYVLLTGRVLSGHQDARINWVGIYVGNEYTGIYDEEPYKIADRAVKIEKTVDKNQVLSGEVVEFTIKVSNVTGEFDTLKVVDTLPKGLVFEPNTQFLTGQTTETTVVSFATGVNKDGLTTLTWELKFPKGFKKSDSFLLKFKSKLVETSKTKYTNVACVFNPDDPDTPICDPEDVMPKTDVKLKIKKYVSTSETGPWEDVQLKMSNGTAFFKLVIDGATAPLTGFRVTDRIEGNLTFDQSSWILTNDAFTGVITFGANNPDKPAYTIIPTVSGTQPADLLWKVDMGTGYFMSGDSLTIIIKAQKKGDQNNIAHVYYPKPDGKEGHDEDPAKIYYTSGGGGGGGWSGGGFSPSCGNGRKNGNEVCDLGGEGVVKGGKLFKYEDIVDESYNGYTCTSTCTLGKDVAPACFNTQNGSISIMRGEVLPFYWNIEGMGGSGTIEQKVAWLKRNYTSSCKEEQDSGKIELESMQCTFSVYGPGRSNSNIVYEFTAPCMSIEGWNTIVGNHTYPAIDNRIEQNNQGWFGGSKLLGYGSQKNVFSTLDNWGEYPLLLPLSSKLALTNFGTYQAGLLNGPKNVEFSKKVSDLKALGEYKLALEKIDYATCSCSKEKDKTVCSRLKNQTDDRICEVNFAVTEPYLIQKSPYGIGDKASDYLGRYQLKNGTSFMDKFFKTSDVTPRAYEPPKSMQSLFITFKNKYQKLAKSVKGIPSLSKVPGKSIYFYTGNGDADIKALLNGYPQKPFTLIASKGQNLVIRGNLLTNAMFMTDGKIIFDAEGSCNGDRRTYGHAGQLAKGIFYATNGFVSQGHGSLKNTVENLSKGEWCNYGNLHIKGVAIGNLQSVVDARRSELYTWFKGTSGGAGDGKEKVDIITNGASVLVEYNPSLRGQLPPGAEEFNKALEVYRK